MTAERVEPMVSAKAVEAVLARCFDFDQTPPDKRDQVRAAAEKVVTAVASVLLKEHEARIRADELELTIEAWIHSEWSNVLLPRPKAGNPVIHDSNAIADWLRGRLERLNQGVARDG